MKTLMIIFLCMASLLALVIIIYAILDMVQMMRGSSVEALVASAKKSVASGFSKIESAKRAAMQRSGGKHKAAKRAEKQRAERRVRNKMNR